MGIYGSVFVPEINTQDIIKLENENWYSVLNYNH